MSGDTDFEHCTGTWLESPLTSDLPISLALRAASIDNARKLENLSRNPGEIEKLRYTDPADGAEKELDPEQKKELNAIMSYKNWLKNENGHADKNKCPLDVTYYDRDDFLDFVDETFDASNPIKYDHQRAKLNMRAALEFEKKMTDLAVATANAMTGGSSNPAAAAGQPSPAAGQSNQHNGQPDSSGGQSNQTGGQSNPTGGPPTQPGVQFTTPTLPPQNSGNQGNPPSAKERDIRKKLEWFRKTPPDAKPFTDLTDPKEYHDWKKHFDLMTDQLGLGDVAQGNPPSETPLAPLLVSTLLKPVGTRHF